MFLLSPPVDLYFDFEKKLEKSSSTNWIFSLQKSISKLIFAGYTGSKNQSSKTTKNPTKSQIELDFSKFFFQKSSTDQQGVIGCRFSIAESQPMTKIILKKIHCLTSK
jgi:hypothetical protein